MEKDASLMKEVVVLGRKYAKFYMAQLTSDSWVVYDMSDEKVAAKEWLGVIARYQVYRRKVRCSFAFG